MKVYRMIPERTKEGGRTVLVDQEQGGIKPLSPKPSQKLHEHSPDGFNWGYGGSGPAQLALALLLDVTGDPGLSLRLYQTFKQEVIAVAAEQERSWHISEDGIRRWIGTHSLDGEVV